MEAVHQHRSRCDCAGRFWADHIQREPFSTTVIATLKQAWLAVSGAKCVESKVNAAAQTIGVMVTDLTAKGWASIRPAIGADFKLCISFQSRQRAEPSDDGSMNADSGIGLHAIRLASRITSLNGVVQTRKDSEGSKFIDVEASSHKNWIDWKERLNDKDSSALRTRRAGLVTTPTRLLCT